MVVAEEVVEEEKSAGEEEWLQVTSRKRGRTSGAMTPKRAQVEVAEMEELDGPHDGL